jgi:hypothetical protein
MEIGGEVDWFVGEKLEVLRADLYQKLIGVALKVE